MYKNSKSNNFKRLRLIVFIIIAIVILNKVFLKAGASNSKTYFPVKTEYLDKIDAKAYLIMEEQVYTAQGDGVVDYSVRDGAKVPKDMEIANLNLLSDAGDLKTELLKVQSAIEYKNQSLNPGNVDYTISDKEINMINSIQDALESDNLKDALIAIETLELNTRKNVDISQIGDLINLSNQELEDKKDELSKKISTSNVIYRAEYAGIVTYKIDGSEGIYSIENIDKLDYDFFEKNIPKEAKGQQNSVKKGDSMYKIINNFYYYMAIPVEDATLVGNFKENDNIELLVSNNFNLKGKIYKINKNENSAVIIAEFDEKLSEMGYDRIQNVAIVKSTKDSYVIKTNSIVESGTKTGVYVKELNGIVKFKPVNIISQNEIDTIVESGDTKGFIKNADKKQEKTITVFDEIIQNPSDIEEGQIIRK